ncbi:GbsR/MarR family transcriptional regulator [Xanthobacteraceae bacterium A53D]
MTLPPMVQDFVLHFGEMGSRWGMNRTLGQIYALLYVAPEPLCAEDMVAALNISRSNVSMSLRELQAWNLVLLKHRPGDRRDFYTTPDDAWQILRTLAEERKRREVDPTLAVLDDLIHRAAEGEAERHAQARMREMHGLIGQLNGWYEDVRKLDNAHLAALLRLGARVTRFLDVAEMLRLRRRAPRGRSGQ